ncbi:NAD(P)/FAD-dependent oxidoreductase [Microbacterium marinilacus]|uniref:FAD-binding oxidoreductase n=1 Tax=Microbacterium marinilacus TaxID=415209 RepID=A0ABP7BQA6_9MICO|nr:FAD-binding oxidoreductase [Microbacterium marinilacus]MBY0689802.1 FAD-binding oxidoreductase [Microbacterium marinilacus]
MTGGHPRVIVVGTGIIGLSLAHSLVRRGARVTLIDAAGTTSGTTATSYAWINSHKKEPLGYHRLNVEGVAAWREVARTDPAAVTFAGHVEIAAAEAHRAGLRARVERLQQRGYGAAWITPAEARSRTVVDVPDDSLAAAFDGEGHAYPLRRIETLRRALDASGKAETATATVTSVTALEDGVEVGTDAGTFEADAAAICAGNGSSQLVATAGGRLPLVPAVQDGPAFGYLADAHVPGHGVTGLVTTDLLSLRPHGPDDLLLQALDLDHDAQPGVAAPAATVREFAQRLGAVLPSRAGRVDGVRVGHRVIPADGVTAAGPVVAGSPVFAVVTHSGVVLAPWLAEVMADEILGGDPHPLLDGFRPDRFLAGAPSAPLAAPRSPGDQ